MKKLNPSVDYGIIEVKSWWESFINGLKNILRGNLNQQCGFVLSICGPIVEAAKAGIGFVVFYVVVFQPFPAPSIRVF